MSQSSLSEPEGRWINHALIGRSVTWRGIEFTVLVAKKTAAGVDFLLDLDSAIWTGPNPTFDSDSTFDRDGAKTVSEFEDEAGDKA